MPQTRCLVWGNNNQNLLSSTPSQCLTKPQQIIFPYQVLKMTATEKHVSFITTSGDVYSYGANTDGRLGVGAKDGFTCHYRNPVKVPLEGKAKEIKSGFSHTIVQLQNNQIYSWGLGQYGSLGIGQFRTKPTPTRVLIPPTIRSISCGAMHTAFIDFDGNLYMCGSNQYGQLGVKTGDKIGTPILVPFGGRVKQVACGVFYTLVLTQQGDVYGMGNNKYAQLGLGHKINQPKPTLIHELGNIVKVQAGYHSGALNSMCQLYLWGCGSFGQLLRPKKIILNCPLSNLQIRGFFGIAISESQNRLFIWGNNTHGELGNGGYISYKVPTQMKQLVTKRISRICCGVNFAIAIVEDGQRRLGQHDPYRVGKSRRQERRVSGYYGRQELSTGRKRQGTGDRVSTGRKRLAYGGGEQISLQRYQADVERHESLSQRTRPLHGYSTNNNHSLSPHNRPKQPHYQQPINITSPPRNLHHPHNPTSATRSIHFPNPTIQRHQPKDTSRSYSPHTHQRNYQDLFLNLSRDYQALAKKYKQLEGQIEEREVVRRSREVMVGGDIGDMKQVKELQLINEALKEQAWMMEKEVIITKEELAVALEKINRLEKQVEHLSLENIDLFKKANLQSSPTKSQIKKIQTSRNDELLRMLGEKEQKLRRVEQKTSSLIRKLQVQKTSPRPPAIDTQLQTKIKKLQQQNRTLNQKLQEQQLYITQLQTKYKQLSLRQRESSSPHKHRSVSPIKSLNEVDVKVIQELKKIIIEKQDTFARILQEKQGVINKLEQDKLQLKDKLDQQKLYASEVEGKFRSVIEGIQQTKIENLSLRETLLKSQDRISDIQTGMRKMVSDKEYQSAQNQLVQYKGKVKELQQKLTKLQFTTKSKSQAVVALQQQRLKLYNMLEDMKNLQKENLMIADKRVNQQKEKTSKTQQKVKQLQVQVKYEKDYSKKVQQKSAQMDKLREDTVNELNRVTETLQKQKKRKKQLQRQVEAFRTTQNELKITKQQLQKQRQLNEDYKDKVLKQYKKKDQLIKEMQKQLQEKQAQLVQLAQKKQSDINRLKQQLMKLRQKWDLQKQQVKRLNKQISNKNQHIQSMSQQIQKLQRKLKHTKQQVDKQVKQRELLVQQVGSLKREISKLVLQKQQGQKRILQLQKDLTQVQNSLRRQKTAKTQVQNQLHDLQSRLDAIKQQNNYMRNQLNQANHAVEQANKVSQQLSNANKQFAQNQQSLNKKIQELQAKVYELQDENRTYGPRYDALIQRNKELDDRNKELSDMVNKAIEIQAQAYKQHILKEVQVSTNQIINDAQDQKTFKQRHNRPQPKPSSYLQQQSLSTPSHHPQTISRINQQPYTKYMNQKIQNHRRRVSQSAQKLAGILDLESGIGGAYSKRSQTQRRNDDENYERINGRMESLKSQKDAFMSKINSFAEKMKLL